ncbi:glycosyltransferase family 4 protein [Helicobacter mustelae]|uniref:Putative glycosyl transferase domain protein n=1 Tax=Helicobacter mustelae (strain ATCC 43772 / CCUG 25715 / CIP 103759 / LMG 18044 / NCTC 12198 / R85-136P) TaxID=679897 RepID=D3UIA7_HELM1|nr:glycosyltransferase family 1 protein [Helicobacter mustelae]CBG40230.1 putative glycosyl transferase domain protein [Helicobacter mustelae 12198]SQH71729.1 glycosyl transferase domain-containing protein [Helicobacter mustelae]
MKKVVVVFDGRVLANVVRKTANRSGVYFTAYNFAQYFSKKCDFYLYADIASHCILQKSFPEWKILQKRGRIFCMLSHLFYYKSKSKKRNLFTRAFSFFLAIVQKVFADRRAPLPPISDIASLFSSKSNPHEIASFKRAIFFSPFFMVPPPFQASKHFIKFVFLHDCIPLVLPEYFPKPSLIRDLFFGHLSFEALSQSLNAKDFYFVNSQYTKKDFLEFFPFMEEGKMQVIPLAADSKTFYPDFDAQKNQKIRSKYGIPQDVQYVFSLCSLEPRKNLVFVVENFLAFLQKHKIQNLIFVMGGGGWAQFLPILREKIKGFKELEEKIFMIGYVDDEDLANLFAHSFCSIYLSHYEGFGMPALEAMQCGAPIIASSTTSLPEVVGDAGILVDPKDAEALQEALKRLYFDREFYHHCRERGVERAKKFDWEKSGAQMLQGFQKSLQ